jgi:hypothetical protein
MKTTFVRAAVLTLTFVGLTAPSLTAKTVSPVKSVSVVTSFVGYPTPMCLPSSGNYCGMQ